MWPYEDHIYGRCKVLSNLHQSFFDKNVVVHVVDQKRMFQEAQGVENACQNTIKTHDQGVSVGQRQQIQSKAIMHFFDGAQRSK